MRINLLDPGLHDVGGHHLDWDLRIARELASRGHEATVYSHLNVSPEVRALFPASVELVPIFRVRPYLDWRKIDPVSGELTWFLDGGAMLASDLDRLREAEIWMLPTVFAVQLYACALARPKAALAGCIHFEPAHLMPNGRMWWRYAFLKTRDAGLRPNLGVTVPILEREYAPLASDAGIRCFPIAHDGTPSGICKAGLGKIGFFGLHRKEKGADVLPALIPQLLRDGFEVVLHDSGNLVNAPAMPRLTRLGYVPSIGDEISKCDLIVTPCDPVAYRARGSGIVWESIASGVPVIVPVGTEGGSLVASTGAGILSASSSAEHIYRSILEARGNYAAIANAALRASKEWQVRHGMKRFVSAMLDESATA